ncbi:class I SAM-dependent methyltransferase [Streptomyces somaliensis DSM 40738]|uniref:Class I SAM-dependent methyltransferase n=1 Tax=Streptomyces somaliensis (strain ATCC 33201 / DSM 40738 / JCM 12659 / KCTC 9044 / NCTC 11332 / NRRL B-12077 / IP 733) TaxID=1134445 RepID=A0AA44ICF2_STRE0|nr:class I SAM-dependent methyltransferase [Streptomyces somaliensis]MCQ0025330.1 class I SAM-dependent methyltransferase [Streptomyces somaliensis DSM 40738]NKY13614.1 class I SAM-dependent methyltransferase [Streptomyces somaliensis DSM 40738]
MTHDHTHMDWTAMMPLLERGAELRTPLYRQAAAWLADLLPVGAARRVLDVGSGPGVLSRLLADAFPYARVVAVDATPELLERARERNAGLGDRFTTLLAELPGDVDGLGEADLVWAGESVHHVGDQRGALAGLARRLRPGGLLALAEGGLAARHLPRDTGLGRPGLEARIEALAADWFSGMRAALPGAREEVEDWPALLAAAGLVPAGTRTFLLDVPAPVPAAVREHVVAAFTRTRDIVGDRLGDEDLAALDRLLDPEDPAGLHRRPDVHLLTARTVHTARRAR